MSEERLKEIEDVNSYEYFKKMTKDWNRNDLSRRCYSLAKEKAELYNEVIKLKEEINYYKHEEKLYRYYQGEVPRLNNEVIRLREIIDKLEKELYLAYYELFEYELVNGREMITNILNILKENNNENNNI